MARGIGVMAIEQTPGEQTAIMTWQWNISGQLLGKWGAIGRDDNLLVDKMTIERGNNWIKMANRIKENRIKTVTMVTILL